MIELIPESLIEHVAERFRVLGDATRLSILRLLISGRELNVGEICEALPGSSQANISKHLRTLHAAGVVKRRKEGTAGYYSLADSSVTDLCDIVCERLKTQATQDAQTFAVA